MIDAVLVTRKLEFIIKDLQSLDRFARMSRTEYQSDDTYELIVERYLERIIGRMIDVNFHLISESGRAPPKDYYDSFIELGKMDILPTEFAAHIAHAAGLRNRIAHEYDEVDAVKIHAALAKVTKEFPEYLRLVRDFIHK
jgi:uncharacterized protein YutE (UPF0331/DUF86 family)